MIASTFLMKGSGLLYCYAVMLFFCGIGMDPGRPSHATDGASETDGAEEHRDSGDHSSVDRIHVPKTVLFKTIFFLVGVLLAYEFNGTQKTLHFVGTYVSPYQIGGTALTSLEYLAITLAFLAVIALACKKSTAVPVGIAAAVLVAASFFSLPTLDRLPFPTLAATATILFFAAWLSLCRVAKTTSVQNGVRLFNLSMAFFSGGGFAGSTLALMVLALLNGDSQSSFFEAFQFALLLSIIIVLIVFNRDIAKLLSHSTAPKPLDFSKLENRCATLIDRHDLTRREGEILNLLARGRNVPSIAEELNISKSTVKSHVIQVYRKIGVNARQQLLDIIYDDESILES